MRLAGPQIEQVDLARRRRRDVRPGGVVGQLGDDPPDRDVLVVVHRRGGLVVVVVEDVVDGVVVDIAAGLDEEPDQGGAVAKVAPVARLVLADRDGDRHEAALDLPGVRVDDRGHPIDPPTAGGAAEAAQDLVDPDHEMGLVVAVREPRPEPARA